MRTTRDNFLLCPHYLTNFRQTWNRNTLYTKFARSSSSLWEKKSKLCRVRTRIFGMNFRFFYVLRSISRPRRQFSISLQTSNKVFEQTQSKLFVKRAIHFHYACSRPEIAWIMYVYSSIIYLASQFLSDLYQIWNEDLTKFLK